MPKKILILTADAGFGHRSAANAILAALNERHSDVTTAIVNPLARLDAPSLLKFAESDYDREVQQSPELYSLGYQASDATVAISLIEQSLIAMLYRPLRAMLEETQPDAIVSTYPLYQAPLAAVFALNGSYVPVIVVVTDLSTVHGLWFHDEVDLCLVPTEIVQAKALASGLPSDRVLITGLPVNPLFARSIDRMALRDGLGWRADRTVALFAGSKRVTKLEPIAYALNHSGFPLELALVTGNNEVLRDEWQSEEWHLPAHLYGFVDNMVDMIRAADLLVCKAGGLIVSEALAAGVPLLIAQAIPGQETGNAEVVEQSGAGEMVSNGLDALVTVCHWLEHDGALLAERAANARKLGRPDAAYQIADLAYQAAHTGAQPREHRLPSNLPQLREAIRSQPISSALERLLRTLTDV